MDHASAREVVQAWQIEVERTRPRRASVRAIKVCRGRYRREHTPVASYVGLGQNAFFGIRIL